MKRRIFFFGLTLTLLFLVAATACADIVAGDSLIVLSNVNWGDTSEQVKAAVPWRYPSTDRGDVTFLTYSKINYTFEGNKARSSQLGFVDDHLMLVQYIYSGETVFDQLLDKQKDLFGTETSYKEGTQYTKEEYTWILDDGTEVSLSPTPFSSGAYLTFENDFYQREQDAKQTDSENVDILFRGIEWGIPLEEVTSQIKVNYWSKPSPDYASTVKSGMMGTNDIKFKDYVRCYTRGTPDFEVAGYPVNLVRLWFAYTPGEDGLLTKSNTDTAFYLAEYEIKPKDVDAVEHDLIEKLSSVYGDIDEESSGGYTIKENHYLWYGANNTILVLTTQRYSSGKDSIQITYGWLDGDQYLQQALDCLIAEEASKIGDGNTDGL